MTREEFKKFNQAAEKGMIADDFNPAFIFSYTSTDLLRAIILGEINPVEIAKREMESRGRDVDGHWVGFDHKID